MTESSLPQCNYRFMIDVVHEVVVVLRKRRGSFFSSGFKDDNCSSSCRLGTWLCFVHISVYHGTSQFIKGEKQGVFLFVLPFFPFFRFRKVFTVTKRTSLQVGNSPASAFRRLSFLLLEGLFLSQILIRDNRAIVIYILFSKFPRIITKPQDI